MSADSTQELLVKFTPTSHARATATLRLVGTGTDAVELTLTGVGATPLFEVSVARGESARNQTGNVGFMPRFLCKDNGS